jgi:hypothetical protein
MMSHRRNKLSMIMEVAVIKIKFLGRRENRADSSFWSPLPTTSTVKAIVLSSNDSNVPTELVLQHDLDCCFQLHNLRTGSLS